MARSSDRLRVVVAGAVYAAALVTAYRDLLAVDFESVGFLWHDLSLLEAVGPWVAALVPLAWLPLRIERPSGAVLWILWLLAYVPLCLIPPHALPAGSTGYVTFVITVAIGFSFVALTRQLPLPRLPALGDGRGLWVAIALLSAAAYTGLVTTFGLGAIDLSRLATNTLLDVYGVRESAGEALARAPKAVAYLLEWQGYVVNPLVVAYGLVRRRPVLVAAGIAGQLVLFVVGGAKSALASLVVVPALLLVLRRGGRLAGEQLAWGATALIGVGALIDQWTGTPVASSLLLRRSIATPGLLTGYYWEYFSSHDQVALSRSIFSGLLSYPYDEPYQVILGERYVGLGASANANLWADGFAQFGLPGVLLVSVLLAMVCWLMDAAALRRGRVLATVCLALPALALVNTNLFTALLTNGILLAVLLVRALPDEAP